MYMHPDIQALREKESNQWVVWVPEDSGFCTMTPPDLVKMIVRQNLPNVLPSLDEQLSEKNMEYFRDLLETPLWYSARETLLEVMVYNDVRVWELPVTDDERKASLGRAATLLFAEHQDSKDIILEKLQKIPVIQETLNAALYHRCPIEAIRWLLDQGLSVHEDDKIVGTPLMWACRRGFENQEPDLEVIQLLLDRSADPLKVCRGMTAMSSCEDTPGGHKAIECIYTNQEQVNAELRAVLRGGRRYREFNPDRIRLLVKLGADVDLNMETSDDEHITPLMYAAHNGRRALIHLLMELGADKDIRAVKDDKDSRAYTFYLNFLTRAKRQDWDTLELLE
jgi:ankyrin repeat protein